MGVGVVVRSCYFLARRWGWGWGWVFTSLLLPASRPGSAAAPPPSGGGGGGGVSFGRGTNDAFYGRMYESRRASLGALAFELASAARSSNPSTHVAVKTRLPRPVRAHRPPRRRIRRLWSVTDQEEGGAQGTRRLHVPGMQAGASAASGTPTPTCSTSSASSTSSTTSGGGGAAAAAAAAATGGGGAAAACRSSAAAAATHAAGRIAGRIECRPGCARGGPPPPALSAGGGAAAL